MEKLKGATLKGGSDALDMEPRHLKMVRAILARYVPHKTVWAYGSRVTWKATEKSDLDCVVFGATETDIAALREAFDDSDIPFEVQVFAWDALPKDFQENIRERYFILQQGGDGLEGWREKNLGSLVNIHHGYAFSGQGICADDTGDVLVTPGNFRIGGGFKSEKFKFFRGSYPESYILKTGDVIVTMTDLSKEGDTLGYSAKVPAIKGKTFLHNQRIGLVQFLSDEADRGFIYWLMRSKDYQGFVVGAATGTSVKHTSPTTIRQYSFLLPPLPEQKAIAGVLGSLDDKIDLLHRQNKTLEAMAETLFRQWFVEEAQEGWEEKPLSDVADFLNGLPCQKFPPENESERLPVLKIRELTSGLTDTSDWVTSRVKLEYVVRAGDVIFSWSASLMVKIWDGSECVLNQHLFKVTSTTHPQWFFYWWCKHHLAEFQAKAAAHATTMGHIKRGDLDEAKVLVPSPPELEAMTQQMQPLLHRTISNSQKIRTLEKLRDTLLPRLMSGEVRVAV